MKYLVPIGVIILLFVLPLISWYYLSTGLNYRKDLEAVTEIKGDIKELGISDTELFKSKTTLLPLRPDLNPELLTRLEEQFDKAPTFQLLTYEDFSRLSIYGDNWKEKSMALIDTSLQIRNIYDDFDKESVKDIVAHTAVTLPFVKSRR